ncbi:hypothetical protein ATZ33_16480 [Enterococcus silesiacus]|uniref:Uncharacterized protein n=1 Tax=Enterococcus silesiacus TaxID=332949 RepID=A0ABM5WCJ8_9ENTE|nr:hypothetical protein ATZ33_16480 [Enterococcus silesiacus]
MKDCEEMQHFFTVFLYSAEDKRKDYTLSWCKIRSLVVVFQGIPNKKTNEPNQSTWVFLNNKKSLKKASFYYTNL